MIYMPYCIFAEVKMPAWETDPQAIFIPRDHHYNVNNKRKKGKKKGKKK